MAQASRTFRIPSQFLSALLGAGLSQARPLKGPSHLAPIAPSDPLHDDPLVLHLHGQFCASAQVELITQRLRQGDLPFGGDSNGQHSHDLA